MLAVRGFCDILGEGRAGLEATEGPVSRRPFAGEGDGLVVLGGEASLPESLGRVEANLLPVDLSLTFLGLNPNKPPPEEGAGAGAGLGFGGCCSCVEAGFLTPPMGGGGGGGGGGPPIMQIG